MQIKYTTLFLLLAGTTAFAQIKTNQNITTDPNSNAFLDASENTDGQSNNIGRGLLFPQTNLSTFTLDINAADGINYPTYFDGMIVYNTHEGDTTTDPSLTTQTENLEKGFYYFKNPEGKDTQSISNGKWVRISDAQANNQDLWKKQENGDIKLVDADLPSNVEYKSYGGFSLSPKENIETTHYNPGTWPPTNSDPVGYLPPKEGPFNTTFISFGGHASKIPYVIRTDTDPNYVGGTFKSNSLLVDPNATLHKSGYTTLSNSITVPPENENNYTSIYTSTNISNHSGKGTAEYIMGNYNTASLGSPDSKGNNIIGSYNQATSYSSHHVPYMKGTYSYVTPRGTGTINQIFVGENVASLNGNSSNVINSMVLSRNMASINNDFQGSVDKLIGTSTYFDIPYGNTSVKELYGLKITNVVVGTEKNYAIYTGLGDIRFGQFKDDNATGNRLLTVDSDGKLVAGESTQSVAPFWSYVPGETKIKLNYLSDGVTPRPDDHTVSIDDFGTMSMNGIDVAGWQYYHNPSLESHFYSNGNKSSRLNFNQEWDGNKFVARSNDGTSTYSGHILFSAKNGELSIGGSPTSKEAGEPTLQSRVLKIDMKNQSVKVGKLNDNTPNNRTLIAVNENGSAGIYKIATPQTGEELGKIDLGLTAGGLYESLASIKTISAGDAYVTPGLATKIGGHLSFSTTPLSYDLTNDAAAPQERMRITSNGNVGIATLTPTEKLEVAGAVKAETFKGSNGATIFPDYVFENYYTGTSTAKADYNFANLSQVESFIKTNGHLPGYVSAKEIKAQGYIDIMDTQLTNVEKIEELYLHTIEQDKAIKAKNAEIAELKSDVQELKTLVKELLNK